ncbi:hypothetical protein SEA_MEYRAN_54 [Gordonia phage Meyran]|nr:hypothetical protein SEA_MEYRAN_54 [Gordonia phage Meyran]
MTEGHPSIHVDRFDGSVHRAEFWPIRLLVPAWLSRDARWARTWGYLRKFGIIRIRRIR